MKARKRSKYRKSYFSFTSISFFDREAKFNEEEYPPSYKNNLPKELMVLQYADNFRRQYVHLYRDRKPLLLNPVNEFYIEVTILFSCTFFSLKCSN